MGKLDNFAQKTGNVAQSIQTGKGWIKRSADPSYCAAIQEGRLWRRNCARVSPVSRWKTFIK
jgi:hypothetical protein